MEKAEDIQGLWSKAQAGDQASVAKLLSLVETDGEERAAIMALATPHLGRAHRIGVSGPPGSGKSTLISQVAKHFGAKGQRVGVVAVDPSSPRTGGALLGDRVRMGDLEGDDTVFIRSLSSRGHGGGLSLATMLVADVLDALGFDPILMETVGVGQSEVDVMRKAHSVVLLMPPGAGDAVQLMKAGLLEVADLLVVNKADREGAQELATLLRSEIPHHTPDAGWEPRVLLTTAYKGEGIEELVDVLREHLEHLQATLGFDERRRSAIKVQLQQLVEKAVLERIWADEGFGEVLEKAASAVVEREIDVASAAAELAGKMVRPAK